MISSWVIITVRITHIHIAKNKDFTKMGEDYRQNDILFYSSRFAAGIAVTFYLISGVSRSNKMGHSRVRITFKIIKSIKTKTKKKRKSNIE